MADRSRVPDEIVEKWKAGAGLEDLPSDDPYIRRFQRGLEAVYDDLVARVVTQTVDEAMVQRAWKEYQRVKDTLRHDPLHGNKLQVLAGILMAALTSPLKGSEHDHVYTNASWHLSNDGKTIDIWCAACGEPESYGRLR
jgi:chemotaxis methyl-accepting protein methylase